MRRKGCWAGLLCGLSAAAYGNSTPPIRVAAASDLKFVLAALAQLFERETHLKLTITYGSSGNLARQLEQGLPADLFLSADEALIARLQQKLWARDAGVVYALGRLAWLVPTDSTALLDERLQGLAALATLPGFKLALANPEHAPYGRAARAALQSAGLWERLQSRCILAENVSQATQFVSSGAAQAGLVSLSLALAPEVQARTRHIPLGAALHPPIIQRMALQRGAGRDAERFYTFLQTSAARRLFESHGL